MQLSHSLIHELLCFGVLGCLQESLDHLCPSSTAQLGVDLHRRLHQARNDLDSSIVGCDQRCLESTKLVRQQATDTIEFSKERMQASPTRCEWSFKSRREIFGRSMPTALRECQQTRNILRKANPNYIHTALPCTVVVGELRLIAATQQFFLDFIRLPSDGSDYS